LKLSLAVPALPVGHPGAEGALVGPPFPDFGVEGALVEDVEQLAFDACGAHCRRPRRAVDGGTGPDKQGGVDDGGEASD
jgi:hypothetical protein